MGSDNPCSQHLSGNRSDCQPLVIRRWLNVLGCGLTKVRVFCGSGVNGMQGFWTFLGAAMFFAAIANICYFVAVGRLIKNGIRLKFLAMPQDTFRVLRQYRALAQENEWPLWPLNGFWMSLIPFAVSAVASICLNAVSPSTTFPPAVHLPSAKAVLLWVITTSLLEAFLFSYRVVRYASEQRAGVGDWRRWIADEYARNDFYLAVLGWTGFLAASVLLMLGRV